MLRIFHAIVAFASALLFHVNLFADDSTRMVEFVKRRGDQLVVGDNEFRFVSFNIPHLHLIEDSLSL